MRLSRRMGWSCTASRRFDRVQADSAPAQLHRHLSQSAVAVCRPASSCRAGGHVAQPSGYKPEIALRKLSESSGTNRRTSLPCALAINTVGTSVMPKRRNNAPDSSSVSGMPTL